MFSPTFLLHLPCQVTDSNTDAKGTVAISTSSGSGGGGGKGKNKKGKQQPQSNRTPPEANESNRVVEVLGWLNT